MNSKAIFITIFPLSNLFRYLKIQDMKVVRYKLFKLTAKGQDQSQVTSFLYVTLHLVIIIYIHFVSFPNVTIVPGLYPPRFRLEFVILIFLVFYVVLFVLCVIVHSLVFPMLQLSLDCNPPDLGGVCDTHLFSFLCCTFCFVCHRS
jgi:hypothetical protein